MRDVGNRNAQLAKYLIWTFAIAYAVQFIAAYVYNNVNAQIGQLIVAAMMFVPALGAVLAGGKLKAMGWNPHPKKNIRYILAAWLAPSVLTAAGAALYFMIFPGHFDLSGEYIAAAAGEEILEQMRAQGVSYPLYVLISVISCVTYAPLVNTFTALGEEIGWRGFMYPILKAKFGRKKGLLLGGALWGAWHWPLMCLIGYEYGAAAGNSAGYAGFPISGMLLFCVMTVGLGVMHDRLYEKSGSIWVPALFHGAINAAAALPLMMCAANTGSARLLGPASVGLISGLPFLITAAVLLFRNDHRPNHF